ncbi:transcription termination factor Rho, partial [Nocardioides astragali]
QDQAKQDQKQSQKQAKQNQNQTQQNQNQQAQAGQGQGQGQGPADDEDDEGGSRRNRRRRGRDRDRTVPRTGARNEPDTTILEDDVLVPAAGILDVLDNCAFVRTSGYLPGPEDVYLSLSMVRKYHLRRGDAVVGQVRQPREGERREKFNPMVRIDSVNGTEAEGAKERPEFADAVPVHPHQRLRLATDDANLSGRVIDIAAPVGKGQRGLVLTPPRTGATSLLQSIAQSVTTNNPECHVMVVLVDTRPEEVTDFQRAVKGEVVASTFDRQPADHTLVAELAIERAKRLVELGHDVVVLLDSLTRLGRAYNLAAPANGRILGGVVDASAVHPTKEFFGAARKIEDAGSLTILATVTVGTGSATDEFFLEELSGTANLELVLSADRAAKGIVPAVDIAASGTRHEEKLLAPAEGAVVGDLRKQLAAADSPQAVTKLVGSR